MEETIREIATWLRFIGRERSARTSGDREKSQPSRKAANGCEEEAFNCFAKLCDFA